MPTTINDLVLVHFEEEPAFFARVEDIEADHKPGWYHATLLVLKVPLEEITWILKEEYINGDSFTMGGKSMRLEKIRRKPVPEKDAETGPPSTGRGGKVVSLRDRKK